VATNIASNRRELGDCFSTIEPTTINDLLSAWNVKEVYANCQDCAKAIHGPTVSLVFQP
jgi:hypothetical protein